MIFAKAILRLAGSGLPLLKGALSQVKGSSRHHFHKQGQDSCLFSPNIVDSSLSGECPVHSVSLVVPKPSEGKCTVSSVSLVGPLTSAVLVTSERERADHSMSPVVLATSAVAEKKSLAHDMSPVVLVTSAPSSIMTTPTIDWELRRVCLFSQVWPEAQA